MISIEEADKLMADFVEAREKYNKTKSKEDLKILKRKENICVSKFDYLIKMRTGKYRLFSNYEDLNQEGREALLNAMKTYRAEAGNWFAWAHKYIATKISRAANLHTTIRYPLKVAKEMVPHKEIYMPEIVEDYFNYDVIMETNELKSSIEDAINKLDDNKQKIMCLAFGLEGDKPMSVNEICRNLRIPRNTCIKEMDASINSIKENIKF